MTDAEPRRNSTEELRSTLRALRERAGLSTRGLAARLSGFSQSKVSRMERPTDPGDPPPTVDDVARVLDALGDVADESKREHVLELARAAQNDRLAITTTRILLQRGYANTQRQWRRRENAADRVGVFHPAIVPGLAQTDGYLREVFGPDVDSPAGQEWFAERIGRRVDRGKPDRPTTLLMTEGTITQPVSDPEVGARQCEHLAELAVRQGSAWRLGVIPAVLKPGQTYDHPPQNGFDLYDDAVIVLGTTAGFAVTQDEDTVKDHVALFRRLEELAVFGEEAARVFERAAARYRDLAEPVTEGEIEGGAAV